MIASPERKGEGMSFDGDLVVIKKTNKKISKQFHQNQNLPILRQGIPLFTISLRTSGDISSVMAKR